VTLLEQVCYGETSARGVKSREVMPVLRDWLTAEQPGALPGHALEWCVKPGRRDV